MGKTRLRETVAKERGKTEGGKGGGDGEIVKDGATQTQGDRVSATERARETERRRDRETERQ